ncbi:MAG: hypothetical protein ACRENE_20715, partial [Polyangiaceae bacterium]
MSWMLVAEASGCSGSTTELGTTCGHGTVQRGQECVSDLDAGDDGATDGDGSVREQDAGSDAVSIADSPARGGSDAEKDTGGDPCNDPMLPPLWVDCSGHCAPALDAAPGTCTAGGSDGLLCPSYALQDVAPVLLPTQDLTIRTPGQPNVACEHACSNTTVTSAIAFKTTTQPPGTIKVPSPWRIQVFQLGTYGYMPDSDPFPA